MDELKQLEQAMERAQKAQLGWVFVREYTTQRKEGSTVERAISRFESKWTVPQRCKLPATQCTLQARI